MTLGREGLWLAGLLLVGLLLPPLATLAASVAMNGNVALPPYGGVEVAAFFHFVNFYEALLWPLQLMDSAPPKSQAAWFVPVGRFSYVPVGQAGAWLVAAAPYVLVRVTRLVRRGRLGAPGLPEPSRGALI